MGWEMTAEFAGTLVRVAAAAAGFMGCLGTCWCTQLLNSAPGREAAGGVAEPNSAAVVVDAANGGEGGGAGTGLLRMRPPGHWACEVEGPCGGFCKAFSSVYHPFP